MDTRIEVFYMSIKETKVRFHLLIMVGILALMNATISHGAPYAKAQLNPHAQAVADNARKTLESVERLGYCYEFVLRTPLSAGFFEGADIVHPNGTRLSEGDAGLTEMLTVGTITVQYDGDVLFLDKRNTSCQGRSDTNTTKDLWYRTNPETKLWVFDRSTFVERVVNHGEPYDAVSVRVTSGSLNLPDFVMSCAVTPALLERAGLAGLDENPRGARSPQFPPYDMIRDDPSTAVVVLEDDVPVGAMVPDTPTTFTWRSFSSMTVDRATSRVLAQESILYDTATSKTIPLQRTEYSYAPPSVAGIPSRVAISNLSREEGADQMGEQEPRLLLTLNGAPELARFPDGHPQKKRLRMDQMMQPHQSVEREP